MVGIDISMANNAAGEELITSLLEQIKAKDAQLASKDYHIATLEKKIVGMSLDLATTKTMEDYHEQEIHRREQRVQQRQQGAPCPHCNNCQGQEARSAVQPPKRSIGQSLGNMFQPMSNILNRENRAETKRNSSFTSHDSNGGGKRKSLFASANSLNTTRTAPTIASSSLDRSLASGGFVITVSKECRKLSMGTSNVVEWD